MQYLRSFTTNFIACLVITLIVTTLSLAGTQIKDKPMTMVTELNVNIIVKNIEPSLVFWGAVGFTVADSVPLDGPGGSGPLGFAILTDGSSS